MSTEYEATCPFEVERATMIHRWDLLTFIHWAYEPEQVQRLLPEGLTVDTYDGKAWVGLVPFKMQVRLPWGPALPWLSNFPETNVRTYVTAPDGTRGVWFMSLEAARLAAVATARTTYRLPYFWAKMTLDHREEVYRYETARRWPGPRGVASVVQVRVGEQYAPEQLGAFDHFLTALWRLYSAKRNGLRYARVQHDPWPLHRAELLELDDSLMEAAGLPAPTGEPVVHWSPGTEVRIGFPHGLR